MAQLVMKKKMMFSILLSLLFGCSQKQSSTPQSFQLQVGEEQEIQYSYNQSGYCDLLEQRLQKAIYGKDGRMNPCQFSDKQKTLELASNVAMLVSANQLKKTGKSKSEELYKITSVTYGEFFQSKMNEPLCDNVPFKNEQAPAFCSAFLVSINGKKRVMTAGHCLKGRDKNSIRIVFSISPDAKGFVPTDSELQKQLVVSSDQIFSIKSVKTDQSLKSLDIALIEVNEEIKAEGLDVNLSGNLIQEGRDVILVGHPVGLEVKFDFSGEIKTVNKNHHSNRKYYFESSVDAFSGNSGSPVLDLETEEVIGILVSGNGDFQKDWFKGCYEERKYSEQFSTEYERSLRIDSVIETFDL